MEASPRRIEVTLESLEGLQLTGSGDLHDISASITFSGSVPSMQVRSCSVCGHSGQLLIESECFELDESKPDGRAWISAKFSSQGPHLTVPLPPHQSEQQPLSVAKKLAESNRDCLVIKDDNSEFMSIASSEMRRQHEVRRGASVVWSADTTCLPEIVELTIRLSSEPQQMGMSHLVVFSNEKERGCYTMELPIKQQVDREDHQQRSNAVFTAQSRIRVRVRLLPSMARSHSSSGESAASALPPSLKSSSSSSSGSSSASFIKYTRSQLADQVGPILEKIQQHEQEAVKYREAQKRAMDVHVDPVENGAGGIHPQGFCSHPWMWKRWVDSLASAVRRCGVNDHASIGSSIKTNDSWEM